MDNLTSSITQIIRTNSAWRSRVFLLLLSVLVFLPRFAFTGTTRSSPDLIPVDRSSDSINVTWTGGSWPLSKIEAKWAEDNYLDFPFKGMIKLKNPEVVDFLYRVVTVDSSLYKGRVPKDIFESRDAIQTLVLIHTPEARTALIRILSAPIYHFNYTQQLEVRALGAQGLFAFKDQDLTAAYSALSKCAENGTVVCPLIPSGPMSRFSTSTNIDSKVQAFIERWMNSTDIRSLQAAECAAEANILVSKALQIAEKEVNAPKAKYPSEAFDKKGYATRILTYLSSHGADRAEDLLQNMKDKGE